MSDPKKFEAVKEWEDYLRMAVPEFVNEEERSSCRTAFLSGWHAAFDYVATLALDTHSAEDFYKKCVLEINHSQNMIMQEQARLKARADALDPRRQ